MKYLLSQVLVAVAASAMPYHGHGYLNNVAVFAAKEAANFAAMATPPILDAVPVAMAARQVADANPMDANAQTAADAAILSAIANPALPNLAAAEAAFAVDPTNAAFAARRDAETLPRLLLPLLSSLPLILPSLPLKLPSLPLPVPLPLC